MLQSYALVPDEYKVYIDQAKHFSFNLESLKVLRDHSLVPLELRLELIEFVCDIEDL